MDISSDKRTKSNRRNRDLNTKGKLTETESRLTAAQNNAIRTKYYKAKIDKILKKIDKI